ncbi:AAA family ATPase [Bifidobacterium jacchi]|uniref:AAA family ATPase n=1 Tax=Bifidobacterium jacchi TaxID=2490545 RepID=UPI003BA9BDC9
MSLGNRKKVGIVQGLMHKPRLIILDEPTSGLDPLAQRAFFDLIREENRRGATVLFSSHILSEVQRICDRVGIIREGRLIAVRSVAEMRRSAVKRVKLGFALPADAEAARRALASMAGVRSLTVGDGDGGAAGASFLYEGDCNALIAALAGLRLADVEIAEPTLEEVFMHYYQRDGRQQDTAPQEPAR